MAQAGADDILWGANQAEKNASIDEKEDGATLSLDHVTPHSHGGGNEASNLVTACSRCNSSRGNRRVEDFAVAVAEYLNHGVTAVEIITHITTTCQRSLPMTEAKDMIARRGSAARVLAK